MVTRSTSKSPLVAGRLALDFANISSARDLSWDDFVTFLIDAGLVSNDRAARLRPFLSTEPRAVDAVLLRTLRLRESLRAIFACIVNEESFPPSWAEPVNEILRITEGHDELVFREGSWSLEFVSREGGLEWLLAAIARSGADLLVEGPAAPIRRCANPERTAAAGARCRLAAIATRLLLFSAAIPSAAVPSTLFRSPPLPWPVASPES